MTIRRKLFTPVSLALALLTTSAMAKIHPTAFKGVTSHFRVNEDSDNTMYSPTFGIVALDTGIVENIRLYGDYTPGFDDVGGRLYIKDTSDDPLWNVVNILFPSNNGQLGTDVNADGNIGRYVKDPKTVALLVHFAKSVYDGKELNITGTIDAIANTLTDTENKSLTGKIKQSIKKGIGVLLTHIQSSIKLEQKNESMYPTYTTVQMIQAFFCYKFNTKDDIEKELIALRTLDKTMVDDEKLDAKDLLKEDDLQNIIKKDTPDIDDLFDLTQTYLFTSPMAYKEGIAPLNNGTASSYDRENSKYANETFPDCVETTIRHLCNLLFFDAKKREFDVSHITNDDLQKFYSKQTSLLANTDADNLRSLWNTVVGDLNTKDDINPIVYNRNKKNELKSGFINTLKVFSKMLGITFDAQPTDTLGNKTAWLQKSLEKLLDTMNPNYGYEVTLVNITDNSAKSDLIGTANITVKEKTEGSDNEENPGQELFSFGLVKCSGHTNITEIKSLMLEEETDKIDKVLTKHSNILQKDTMEESLMLLSPELSKSVTSPLYKLFNGPLSDNDSKIAFLGRVMKLVEEEKEEDKKEKGFFKQRLTTIKTMMGHVMEGLNWEDWTARFSVNSVISTMARLKDFKEVVREHARAMTIKDLDWDGVVKLAGEYKKLEYVDLSSCNNIKGIITLPKSWGQLKMLNLLDAGVETIEGLENVPNLKELNLEHTTKLKSLILKEDMKALKMISLNNSHVEMIELSGSMLNLKILDLTRTQKLTSLTFEPQTEEAKIGLKNLSIALNYSNITKFNQIKGYKYLTEDNVSWK